jgi:hypothetical protein
MMKTVSRRSIPTLAIALLAIGAQLSPSRADGVRQYYDTTWTYSSSYGYYYTTYYYQSYTTTTTYDYHYCIYYPSQPSYIYYYNPSRSYYWGRYEVGSKGDKRYSKLEEKDRKPDLKEIPPNAFPEAAKMPAIPGSNDNVAMAPPPEQTLPKGKPADDSSAKDEKKDLPGGKGVAKE